MFVPYTPLSDCRTPRKTRDLHSLLTLMFAGFMLTLLLAADPHHHYAIAFINAAAQWLHAAFPQLIK